MGKVPSTHLPGISREDHVPLRPRDLALFARRLPSTPSDYHDRKGHYTRGRPDGMGANIKLRLEMYEEVIEVRFPRPVLRVCSLTLHQGAADGFIQDPDQFTLMLKLDAPLPTHAVLNTSLDSYAGVSRDAPDAPFWLQQIQASWLRPKRFKCSLGWLRSFVNNILDNAPSEAHADPVYAPWRRIEAHLLEVVVRLHLPKF